MKQKLISGALILCSLLMLNFSSCKKDELDVKTSVTFNFTDEAGTSGDIYYRIIEQVSDPTTTFTIVDKYKQKVTGAVSYTFDDVEPGNYAAILGTVGETYRNFSIAKGERVTVNIKRYVAYYLTYNYIRYPVYGWTASISK